VAANVAKEPEVPGDLSTKPSEELRPSVNLGVALGRAREFNGNTIHQETMGSWVRSEPLESESDLHTKSSSNLNTEQRHGTAFQHRPEEDYATGTTDSAQLRDWQGSSSVSQGKSDWVLRTEAAFRRYATDSRQIEDDVVSSSGSSGVGERDGKPEGRSEGPSEAGGGRETRLKPKDREAEQRWKKSGNITSGPEFRIVPAATLTSPLARPGQQDKLGLWLQTWRDHKSMIYLGFAGLILVLVIASWSAPANNSSSQHGFAFVENLLVSTGLARPQPQPGYGGNPDVQVWVDVQSASYFCPGAREYGTTKPGAFRSQRDAQLHHFEPAYRRACP
jgi:hypothetical protein